MANVEQVLRDTGVIPVIKLEDEQKAVSLGRALLEGGIPAAEVTFRTPAAAKSIENIAKALPEMFVCAGTVLSVEQAKLAVDCGAKAVISPGTNRDVVEWCVKNNVPVYPGCATPSEVEAAMGMGLTTAVVLTMSNLIISLLRKVIPSRVRIPAFIVIIASFVTAVQLLLQAYLPSLNDALGVYIPLIVVNCIILGRAESYASKNPVVPSIFDGLGMGLGFTLGLTLIGLFRELLGAGQIFGAQVLSLSWFTPITIFVMAPGAFLVLACLVAVMNIVRAKMEAKGKPLAKPSGCITGDCAGCGMSATCTGKKPESAAAEKTE